MERKNTFNEVAEDYDKIRPVYPNQLANDIVGYSNKSTPSESIKTKLDEIVSSGLFKEIEVKEYKWEHKYSSKDYVSLLNTHSKHRQLEEYTRNKLLNSIEEAINNYDGYIQKPQLVSLFLGRKVI